MIPQSLALSLPILTIIFTLAHDALNLQFDTPYSQVLLLFTPDHMGLDNCSYVTMPSRVPLFYFRWEYVPMKLRGLPIDDRLIFVNTTRYFTNPMGLWSNKQDEFIHAASDNVTMAKFVQMVNMRDSTYYNFTQVPGFIFAAYINRQYVLMIDSVYPYSIYNGSIKLNNFVQVLAFPPIYLTPSENLACDQFMNCMWPMMEGMIVNYPMSPSPKIFSLFNDSIVCVLFATVNNTNLMYTGTMDGLVIEWLEVGLSDYKPQRVNFNLAGSPIKDLMLVQNKIILAQNYNALRQNIYLPQSQLIDCFQMKFLYNITTACEASDQFPIIHYHVRQVLKYGRANFGRQLRPNVGLIENPRYTSFHNLTCVLSQQPIQFSPGANSINNNYECYFDESTILSDGGMMPNIWVANCIKYNIRYQAVCVECANGYVIDYINQTTFNNEFQYTICVVPPTPIPTPTTNTTNTTNTNTTGAINITNITTVPVTTLNTTNTTPTNNSSINSTSVPITAPTTNATTNTNTNTNTDTSTTTSNSSGSAVPAVLNTTSSNTTVSNSNTTTNNSSISTNASTTSTNTNTTSSNTSTSTSINTNNNTTTSNTTSTLPPDTTTTTTNTSSNSTAPASTNTTSTNATTNTATNSTSSSNSGNSSAPNNSNITSININSSNSSSTGTINTTTTVTNTINTTTVPTTNITTNTINATTTAPTTTTNTTTTTTSTNSNSNSNSNSNTTVSTSTTTNTTSNASNTNSTSNTTLNTTNTNIVNSTNNTTNASNTANNNNTNTNTTNTTNTNNTNSTNNNTAVHVPNATKNTIASSINSSSSPSTTIPPIAQQALNIFNATIVQSQTSFFYVKNLLQLTLFAFVIHSLLSFWAIVSLYYFLPLGPPFLKYILLIMWRTYNISALNLFGIQQPDLPNLSHQASSMTYGEVTISNDFLNFTFDPFVMFIITFINYCISFILRKFIKCLLQSWGKLKLAWLKFDMFENVSDIIIELLPILFLPCTNFIFNPHFTDYLEKINLTLFSMMAGFGVIFPFFYFSKLVKSKSKQQRQQRKKQAKKRKLRKQKQNKKQMLHKSIHNKIKSQKQMPKKDKPIQKMQFFIVSRCNEIDDFLNCILHLTVSVTVALTNPYPFFIVNGFICACIVANVLLFKKGRLNGFIHRLYFIFYHACFVVMYIYQGGDVYFIAAVVAAGIIFAKLAHQLLELLYKIIKFVANLVKDCRQRNRVINIQNHNSKQKATVKVQKLFTQAQMDMKVQFKQFMRRKQRQKLQDQIKKYQAQNKLIRNQKSRNSDSTTRYDKSSGTGTQSRDFFKQEQNLPHDQVLPFAAAISGAIDRRRQKKRLRLRKQRLNKRFNELKVQQKIITIDDQLQISSQNSCKDLLSDDSHHFIQKYKK